MLSHFLYRVLVLVIILKALSCLKKYNHNPKIINRHTIIATIILDILDNMFMDLIEIYKNMLFIEFIKSKDSLSTEGIF